MFVTRSIRSLGIVRVHYTELIAGLESAGYTVVTEPAATLVIPTLSLLPPMPAQFATIFFYRISKQVKV